MKKLVKEWTQEKWVIRFYEETDSSAADQLVTYGRTYKSGDCGYFTNLIGIEVLEGGQLKSACFIAADGGKTGITKTTALINHEEMVICCGNTVFKLTLPDLNLVWQTICDTATCFGIYDFQQDYIVHGEQEISRLDQSGKIVWQRGGRDIWTTLSGADDLVVYDNHIIATDWRSNKYKFDADGNQIELGTTGPVNE